jgi:hypothetical protein
MVAGATGGRTLVAPAPATGDAFNSVPHQRGL